MHIVTLQNTFHMEETYKQHRYYAKSLRGILLWISIELTSSHLQNIKILQYFYRYFTKAGYSLLEQRCRGHFDTSELFQRVRIRPVECSCIFA